MPRFFIDTSDGYLTVDDQEGQEFADAREARDAAVAILPEMARNALPEGEERIFTSSVRDSEGRLIYSVSMELKGVWQADLEAGR